MDGRTAVTYPQWPDWTDTNTFVCFSLLATVLYWSYLQWLHPWWQLRECEWKTTFMVFLKYFHQPTRCSSNKDEMWKEQQQLPTLVELLEKSALYLTNAQTFKILRGWITLVIPDLFARATTRLTFLFFSEMSWLFAMKFGSDIHGPTRMNCCNFGYHLHHPLWFMTKIPAKLMTFPSAPAVLCVWC